MKKIFTFFITLFLLMSFSLVTLATGDTTILKTVNHPNGVYHFGSNEYVEIIKDYETSYSEMRGVWVATVYNIAISSQDGVSDEAIKKYKAEFLEILDRMQTYGMNTIFFQVRPSNDAFYQSSLNPWSEFLAGSGVYPGWDPLEWMINETHKRGYTFMCWMNAFRVTTTTYITDGTSVYSKSAEELVQMKLSTLSTLADGNFAKEHPEYVVAGTHDAKLILNPSEPAVQKFIVDTIMEIVENYDVDGLHFDDYFYLSGDSASNTSNTNFAGGDTYKESGKEILNDWPNYNEYLKDPKNYGKDAFGADGIYGMEKGLNLGDFRRENINIMMRNIRKQIDEYNEKTGKCVEFGTKPAAVWRSNSEFCSANSTRCSENGSNTHEYAYSTYADLYADSLTWVEEGLVDWVAPQVYYSFEDTAAPYADVVDWWAKQVERINATRILEGKKEIRLYIAHGIYKYRDAPDQFNNINEFTNQLKYNKHYDVIKGSAVYSYEILYMPLNSTITDKYPNAENIRKSAMYAFKTLWSSGTYPLEVGENDAEELKLIDYYIKESTDKKIILNFDTLEGAKAYGVYKVPNEIENFNDKMIEYRQRVIYSGYEKGKKVIINLDDSSSFQDEYTYYIVPVSKNGYVSKNYTKIELSNIKVNEAPNTSEIIINDYTGEVKTGTTISGSFEIPTDPNNDSVSYTIVLIEDGMTTSISPNIEVIDNTVFFSWKTFLIESANCQIKVIFSDGEMSSQSYSKTFNLVDYLKPHEVDITLDKKIYNSTEKVSINFTDIIDLDSEVLVTSYLVIDKEKINITENYNCAINNQFQISLPKVSSDDCYIEFVLSDGYNLVISKSDLFKIELVNTKPNGGSVIINSNTYLPKQILQGTFILPTDADNDVLNYKLYLVGKNYREEIEILDNNNFEVIIPKEIGDNYYIEMVVDDGYEEVIVKSSEFNIVDSQEEPSKGCSNCKKGQVLITQSLILLSTFCFIIIKRLRRK